MAKLMEDEKAMLPDDGVSPIDSENKYFFLDFFGLKRNHIRFLNFFKHENLFDIEKPSYSSTKVWNKEPTLYKESFDEFGHTIDLVEIPPCIFIENDEELMNLMKVSDGNYKFPSSINSTTYNKYTSEGKLLTNLIYLISKPTTETTITDKNGNVFSNANNSYYEYIITSIEYNSSTGMYDLKWEMLGGKDSEGGSSSSNIISISETVVVSTLPAGSEATASIEELTKTEHLTVYQLHLGIPSGKNGENGKDGTNGIDGKEVQLQVSETSIQWKYDTEEEWKDLITLESLKGPQGEKGDKGEDGSNGKEIELQKTETEIEWKYVTDEEWKSLVLLSDIKGEDGETGPQGIQGETGEKGTDGKSAYEIAKEKGFDGTEAEWLVSLKGKDGTTPDTSKFLTKDNTEEFTPTDNYNPVHKKYVDDLIGDINTILSSLTTV